MGSELAQGLNDFVARRLGSGDVLCEVDSVDTTGLTCYCVAVGDAPDMMLVKLIANPAAKGLILIPTVGSKVIVSNSDGGPYVSMFSTVSEIRLNGSNYDGLVKINSLITKMNNIESLLNKFVANVNGWTPVANDGGAALKTLFTSNPVAVLTQTIKSDLENTTVKQGNGA